VANSLDAVARTQSPSAPTQDDLKAVSQGGPFRSFASYSKKTVKQQNRQAESNNLPTPLRGSLAYSRSLLVTYTLSIQALCNVGVRGTEPVRTRVVEAGVLKVAARVLRSFLEERDQKAAEMAEKAKQQLKTIRATTWDSTNPVSDSFSPASSTDNLVQANVVLSIPSSQPPTRTQSPFSAIQASSSTSNVTGLLQSIVADDLAGSSDGDQEREDEEPLEQDIQEQLAVLQCRGRARSITNKSGPASVDTPADRDAEMAEELQSQQQPMDLDDDLETVIDTRSRTTPTEPARTTPDRDSASLRSPSTSYPPPLPQVALLSPSSSSLGLPTTQEETFRFREEEVLTCLQLLAYLSKYPHVRAVFHDPECDYACSTFSSLSAPPKAPSDKTNNIFSLVEKFTVRPAPGDRVTPRLPTEIQYWAGVIMRNACRKDEARDGIRQCANMLCGAWESFPREFAKCRRCRKAKYCSKTCQSRAWQGGHRSVSRSSCSFCVVLIGHPRYWCSAKDGAEGHAAKHEDRRREVRVPASQATLVPLRRTRPRAMTDTTAAPHRFNEEDDQDDDALSGGQQDAVIEIAEMGDASQTIRRVSTAAGHDEM